MRYAWIEANRDSFPVSAMCRVLQVSKSGYYKWRSAEPSARRKRRSRLDETVQQIHSESDGIYGSYKIAEIMQSRDDVESACRNTVAAAMKRLDLKSKVSKQFKPKTTIVDENGQPTRNLLNQVFEADAPNQRWVTDITYLATDEGWVYLAAILDLFSRKIVGWSMSNRLTTPLVSKALRNAIESRQPKDLSALVHHSDRGSQYTSTLYRRTLQTLGITCSMSGTGCCYDNAVMERFFWSLKHEWTNHRRYADLEDARQSVFKYIEMFYNPTRIHQTLGYLSPDEFELKSQATLAT